MTQSAPPATAAPPASRPTHRRPDLAGRGVDPGGEARALSIHQIAPPPAARRDQVAAGGGAEGLDGPRARVDAQQPSTRARHPEPAAVRRDGVAAGVDADGASADATGGRLDRLDDPRPALEHPHRSTRGRHRGRLARGRHGRAGSARHEVERDEPSGAAAAAGAGAMIHAPRRSAAM